jgi:hypothetical protein
MIRKSLKQMFAVCMAVALVLCAVPANAQAAITATPATVSLSYTVGESITISALPASVTFTGATPTTGAITVTTNWVLNNTRTFVDVNWGVGSTTAALTDGASHNIPASNVFESMGGAYAACNQAAGATELTPLLTVGAICNHGEHIAITGANQTGSKVDTLTLQLQGLGVLPAGTYSGTFTVVAGAV